MVCYSVNTTSFKDMNYMLTVGYY